MPRHMNDLGLGLPALGDIFISREPAAIRGARIAARDYSAVVEVIKMRTNRLVPKESGMLFEKFFGCFSRKIVDRYANPQHVLVGHPGLDLLRRQTEDFKEA